MKRALIWILVVFAAIGYSLLIYSWWLEGNANQRQYEVDQQMEDMRMYRRVKSL